MPKVIYQDNLLEKIFRAIYEKDDSRKFRRLLFGNKKLTGNQSVNSEFMLTVVNEVSRCQNEETVQALVEFLESEGKDDLEKQLIANVLRGDVKSAESLLKNGVKIEDVGKDWDDYNLPALFSSALHRKTKKEILRLLIKHGLNIHILGAGFGGNLYHVIDSADIAEILFDSGLTAVDELNFDGKSPLHRAIIFDNFKLVEFLVSKGADVVRSGDPVHKFPLRYAFFYHGNEDAVLDLLMFRGADVNFRDGEFGWTVLHEACKYCNESMIKIVLKKGADVNAEDKNGRTPIFLLNTGFGNYENCLVAMTKALARSKQVSDTNLSYVRSHAKAREMFDECLKELSEMRGKIFYAPYSYYSVLEMSKRLKKLANLTKNEDFMAGFQDDLSSFSFYKEDLREIVEDAVGIRDESLLLYYHLKLSFKDYFPDIVLDNLVKNLRFTDLIPL